MPNESEIDLIDYLNVIWKRKGLIIGGTLVAATTALLVSLSMPKTYEVSRTLKIGSLPGSIQQQGPRLIESRGGVINRLRDDRLMRTIMEKVHSGSTTGALGYFVSIDTKTNPDVRYTARGNDPEVIARIADQLAQHIIKIHRQIFERAMQITKDYEVGTAAKIGSLEAEIRSLKTMASRMMKTSQVDPSTIALLQASIGDRERILVDLRRERINVRLSKLGSENTSVIAASDVPKHPVKPRIKLNVVLAGTLGLMGFTFLAFFLEQIENARRNR